MAKDPNEFLEPTKLAVAKAASFTCSNPACEVATAFAADTESGHAYVGKTAHIFGGKKGSARWVESQSPEERRAPSNAIHLCGTCHDLIDVSEELYPAELLKQWRADREQAAKQGGFLARPFEVRFESLQFLSANPGDATLKPSDGSVKEHFFSIRNGNALPVSSVRVRIEMPETILLYKRLKRDGVIGEIEVGPVSDMTMLATSESPIDYSNTKDRSSVYEAKADQILPRGVMSFHIQTSGDPEARGYIRSAVGAGMSITFHASNPHGHTGNFAGGYAVILEYQFQWRNLYHLRKFRYPVRFDPGTRTVGLGQVVRVPLAMDPSNLRVGGF